MTYHLKYRLHETGIVTDARFENALARALFVIGWSARMDILEQWTEGGQ